MGVFIPVEGKPPKWTKKALIEHVKTVRNLSLFSILYVCFDDENAYRGCK